MTAHRTADAPAKPVKRLILPLTPQTFVRVVDRDKFLSKIPEECPYNCGLPRRRTSKEEGCRHSLSMDFLARKRRIDRYYEYKDELGGMAKRMGFTPPPTGSAVFFFMPIAKRWNKTQRSRMHMQPHTQKPDLSNLLKAYEDSMLKEDETIWYYSGLGKFWVDTWDESVSLRKAKLGSGWIEVHLDLPVYNPQTQTWQTSKP